MSYLEKLVDTSVYILRETEAQFKKPCILWSTGKDSTTMLSLIRESFFGEVPWDVVHIDTGWKFPEIYEFRDKTAKEWNLPLVIAKSPLAGRMKPEFNGITHAKCCQKLKTEVLRRIIERKGYDAVIVSIRRDEHYMRNLERISSPRDKKFRWNFLRTKKRSEKGDAPFEPLQDTELWDLYASDFGEVHHVRRHPMLHWSELDVWEYIKSRGLPYNPLYRADYVAEAYPEFKGKRFRSLGCKTCTFPICSEASQIDEIIAEIQTTRVPERSGRAQDKEKEQVMRKLRALGYP